MEVDDSRRAVMTSTQVLPWDQIKCGELRAAAGTW